MITDLWIENFKGIGKRQHIPLRPVTLLFGANSAGKSTVLHALMYLKKAYCENCLDPRQPIAGADTINLGGLDNLLHRGTDGDHIGALEICCAVDNISFVPNCSHYCLQQVNRASDRQLAADADRRFQTTLTQWLKTAVSSWHVSLRVSQSDSHPRKICHELVFSCGSIKVFSLREGTGSGVNSDHISKFNSDRGRHGWVNPFQPLVASKFQPFYQEKFAEGPTEAVGQQYSDRAKTFLEQYLYCQETDRYSVEYLDRIVAEMDYRNHAIRVSRMTGISGIPSVVEHSSLSAKQLEEWVSLGRFLEVFNGLKEPMELTQLEWCQGAFVKVEVHYLDADKEIPFILAEIAVVKDSLIGAIEAACILRTAIFGNPLYFEILDIPQGLVSFSSSALTRFDDVDLNRADVFSKLDYGRNLAIVDAALRGSIASIRHALESFNYVGPKRSTVPRHLSSDTIDDAQEWGAGLGAWRWLLSIDKVSFEVCSKLLASHDEGLGTGVILHRESYFLVPAHFVEGWAGFSGYPYLQHHEERTNIVNKLPTTKILLLQEDSSRQLHAQDLGEGITQVVPVIAAAVKASVDVSDSGVSLFAIEQPELHLHPSLAAKLGDLFIGTTIKARGTRAIIETHSEHLILRILRRIRQTTNNELPEHIPPVRPDDVCVLWVDNLGEGTTFTRLRIDANGEFIDRWPKGFFREREEDLFG